MLRNVLVIVWIVLSASACCSSREVSSDVRRLTAEVRDSVRVEQVMVAVHDTIVETTTIVVRENEAGDTLRLSRVTERDRVRDRAQVKDREERVVVRTDTVFVEKRDSVLVQKAQGPGARDSPFTMALKWVFWIVLALIGLGIVLRLRT